MDAKRMAMVGMLAIVVALGFAGQAQALPLSLTVGGGSSLTHYNYGGPNYQTGLGVLTQILVTPHTFDLNFVGDSHSFDYFRWLNDENDYNSSNDGTKWDFTAVLDLDPPAGDPTFVGKTYADNTSHGTLDFGTEDTQTMVANGCTYTVALTPDPSYSNFGRYDWRTIQATVTLVSCDDPPGGQDPIAEPAGLSMLGLALLTIRKRRS